MRRLNISHVTEYQFASPVLLLPHRLLLRPRENHNLRIESSLLDISPAHSLQWKRDALDNSVANQTYNTPALATLVMLDAQLQWMLSNGGLDWCIERSFQSAGHLYGWAESSSYATPFVADPMQRSNVVGTIDLTGVESHDINAALRANGIVDTDSYRKLGRNQLRIAMFPAIEPDDIRCLTGCIDHVVGALA